MLVSAGAMCATDSDVVAPRYPAACDRNADMPGSIDTCDSDSCLAAAGALAGGQEASASSIAGSGSSGDSKGEVRRHGRGGACVSSSDERRCWPPAPTLPLLFQVALPLLVSALDSVEDRAAAAAAAAAACRLGLSLLLPSLLSAGCSWEVGGGELAVGGALALLLLAEEPEAPIDAFRCSAADPEFESAAELDSNPESGLRK